MDNKNETLIYKEYISRINKVQDYINANIDKELTLEELALVSGFSKYHFHRIFKSIMQETLYKYINRLRLEKAANFLICNAQKTITEIAMDVGFSNSVVFAHSFKKLYGISATEFRLINSNDNIANSNCDKPNSNNSKDVKSYLSYNENTLDYDFLDNYKLVECKIDVKKIEEMTVIYLRYTGPYKNNSKVYVSLIQKLLKWAKARDLLNSCELKLLTIYHDNPEITKEEKQRTSICMVVPEETIVDGDVGKMTITSGKYAIGSFEIDSSEYNTASNEYNAALNYFLAKWLPSSGYQADDGFFFELYKNDPNTHPQKKALIDIYLPVKPL